uniref:Protein lifeguard 4 n=1 Tax=Castor canadensis TaxID=51338 RepID=A0A8C0XP26_CASCN
MAEPGSRYPCSSIEDDFNYGSCVASASVHIRMAFLRKVYSILSLQVLLTTVTSAVFLYFESIRTFVHASPALILVSALGSLGLIFALTLNRHKHPLNLYLLFGFVSILTMSIPLTFSLSFQ